MTSIEKRAAELRESQLPLEARTLEFLSWALNGEEVEFAALTTSEVDWCMTMAKIGWIHFNRVGTTASYVFGETAETRGEWRRLIDRQGQRERAAGYLEGALF